MLYKETCNSKPVKLHTTMKTVVKLPLKSPRISYQNQKTRVINKLVNSNLFTHYSIFNQPGQSYDTVYCLVLKGHLQLA